MVKPAAAWIASVGERNTAVTRNEPLKPLSC
jgi:hypothetical protein